MQKALSFKRLTPVALLLVGVFGFSSLSAVAAEDSGVNQPPVSKPNFQSPEGKQEDTKVEISTSSKSGGVNELFGQNSGASLWTAAYAPIYIGGNRWVQPNNVLASLHDLSFMMDDGMHVFLNGTTQTALMRFGDAIKINNPNLSYSDGVWTFSQTPTYQKLTLTGEASQEKPNEVPKVTFSVSKDKTGNTVLDVKDEKGAPVSINSSAPTAAAPQKLPDYDNEFRLVRKEYRGGVATAVATASLPQSYRPGMKGVAVAAAHYKGANAIAIGASTITESGHTVFKVNAAVAPGNNSSVGAGVGYFW